MERSTPLITVIAPVWNGERTIDALLEALSRQTLLRENFQVIVVDNGSSDSTSSLVAKWPGVDFLIEDRPGSYAARNRGIKAARANILAFTDADCIPSETWLENAFEQFKCLALNTIIAGKINLFSEQNIGRKKGWSGAALYELVHSFDQKLSAANNVCTTANWICSVQLFHEAGLFDDALKSGGDGEMAKRAVKHGYKIVYADDVVVSHPTRDELRPLLNKRRRVVGGKFQLMKPKGRIAEMLIRFVYYLFKEAYLTLRSDRIGFFEKIRVLPVPFLMFAASVSELSHLAHGAAPRRQ